MPFNWIAFNEQTLNRIIVGLIFATVANSLALYKVVSVGLPEFKDELTSVFAKLDATMNTVADAQRMSHAVQR